MCALSDEKFEGDCWFKEIQTLIKSKQDEINTIRDLTDNINVNLSKLKYEIANLNEILLTADSFKKRYCDIFVQISERSVVVFGHFWPVKECFMRKGVCCFKGRRC